MDNQSMNNNTNNFNQMNTNNTTDNFNQMNGQQPYPNVVPVQVVDNSGKALPALICGILSIVFSFIIPIAGLVFGCIAMSSGKKAKTSTKAGMGKAGFVTGIIGIVISIVLWILNIVVSVALIANI